MIPIQIFPVNIIIPVVNYITDSPNNLAYFVPDHKFGTITDQFPQLFSFMGKIVVHISSTNHNLVLKDIYYRYGGVYHADSG
jgi:hypothetical protein